MHILYVSTFHFPVLFIFMSNLLHFESVLYLTLKLYKSHAQFIYSIVHQLRLKTTQKFHKTYLYGKTWETGGFKKF